MHQIEINVDEQYESQLAIDGLVMAAKVTLQHQQAPAGELTVLITHDEMLAALNQSYRGIPNTTDVLSFPSGDAPPIPGLPHYFGDIAISLPQASTQATAGRHPVMDELQLLVVHGVLHLLGHDHGEPEEKQRMWQAQTEILEQLGCAARPPGDD